MQWKCYKLIYKTISPIHIGYHTLGFIQRTRTYIPGKNIWAVITERLTRRLWPDVQNKERPYENIGREVANSILPTYFYPAIEEMKLLFPSASSSHLGIPASIEPLLMCSFGETAIDPSKLGAEEGSLHETEYIVNKIDGKDVYFIGYLFLKEGARINAKGIGWAEGEIVLKDLVKEIQVGGNRRYGFGRLSLKDCSEESKDIFSLYNIDLTNERPKVTNLNQDTPLLAHTDVEKARYIQGDIEPLVGREWRQKKSETNQGIGAGHRLSQAKICWMPGSIVKNIQTFTIGEQGIWRV